MENSILADQSRMKHELDKVAKQSAQREHLYVILIAFNYTRICLMLNFKRLISGDMEHHNHNANVNHESSLWPSSSSFNSSISSIAASPYARSASAHHSFVRASSIKPTQPSSTQSYRYPKKLMTAKPVILASYKSGGGISNSGSYSAGRGQITKGPVIPRALNP